MLGPSYSARSKACQMGDMSSLRLHDRARDADFEQGLEGWAVYQFESCFPCLSGSLTFVGGRGLSPLSLSAVFCGPGANCHSTGRAWCFPFLDNLSINFPINAINATKRIRTSTAILVSPNQARNAHAMSRMITTTGKLARMVWKAYSTAATGDNGSFPCLIAGQN